MKRKIKVVLKRVGQPPIVMKIKNSDKAIRKLIGAQPSHAWYSEMPDGWIAYNNPYSQDKELLPNIRFTNEIIYGDILVVSFDDAGDSASLTSKEIKGIMKYILDNDVSDFDDEFDDFTIGDDGTERYLN